MRPVRTKAVLTLTTHLEGQGRGHPQFHILGKKLRHSGYTWAIKLDCELNFSPKHPSSHWDLLLHAKTITNTHTPVPSSPLTLKPNGVSLCTHSEHVTQVGSTCSVSHLDILTSYSIWCHLFSCTASEAVCSHVSASALLSHSGLWHHCSWIQPAGDIQWWKF